MTTPSFDPIPIPGQPPARQRKPRQKKWHSEIARQTHSNMRRTLAKEAAEREEKQYKQAQSDLHTAKRRIKNVEENKRTNMVGNGLTPRLLAVMNSWGLRLPVTITPNPNFHAVAAWTDFASITVQHDNRLGKAKYLTDVNGVETVVPIPLEEQRQVAAETRGLFYHEVGHNLFTVPFPRLLDLAERAGFNVIAADIANEKNVRVGLGQTESDVALEDREWEWVGIRTAAHHAWNILEDQRMEQALVNESPQIAGYLTLLVLRQIMRSASHSWVLTAGRTYLPNKVRARSRRQWQNNVRNVTPGHVKAIVVRYCNATDAVTMVEAVVDMMAVLNTISPSSDFWPDSLDDHGQQPGRRTGDGERITVTGKRNKNAQPAPPQDDDQDDDAASGNGTPDPDADEEGEGGSDGDKADEESDDPDADGPPSDAPQAGDGSDEEGTEPDLDDIDPFDGSPEDDLDEAMDDLADDETLQEDIAAINESYNTDEGNLPKYSHGALSSDTSMGDDLIEKAHAIVEELVQAFQAATADCAPHWEEQQRRGVLNVMRYATRQPGDLEIFRQYTDSGDPGTDVAVSLFLDVSGSMSRHVAALGAAAWATKMACSRIGIDCDVTLFDTQAWSLYGAEEGADTIPLVKSHGGTNPAKAMDAVLYEKRQKKHHLVMVMTDGAWQGDDSYTSLARNHQDNHRSMVFYFGGGNEEGLVPDLALARRCYADEAYTISDLLDIPRALESMLIGIAP